MRLATHYAISVHPRQRGAHGEHQVRLLLRLQEPLKEVAPQLPVHLDHGIRRIPPRAMDLVHALLRQPSLLRQPIVVLLYPAPFKEALLRHGH